MTVKSNTLNWKLEPRWTRLKSPRPEKILSASDVVPVMEELLKDRPKQEAVYVLLLTAQNQVDGIYQATLGLVNHSMVNVQEVFKPAILTGASAIIMIHNHPSGTTKASAQDLQVTQELIKAGELLGIPLLDSLIVVSGGFSSIRALHPNFWS